MKQNKSDFYSLVDNFHQISIISIYEKFHYKSFIYSISAFIVFALLSIIVLICIEKFDILYIFGLAIPLFIALHKNIETLHDNAIKYYGDDAKSFIKMNKEYYRGLKVLMFYERMKGLKIENNFFDLAKYEIELKNNDMLNNKFLVIMLGLLSLIGSAMIGNLPFEVLALIFIIIIIMLYFGYIFISINRSKKSKMQDFQLCIIWQNEIEKILRLKTLSNTNTTK